MPHPAIIGTYDAPPQREVTIKTVPRSLYFQGAPRVTQSKTMFDPDTDDDLKEGDLLSRWDAYLKTKPGTVEALAAMERCK